MIHKVNDCTKQADLLWLQKHNQYGFAMQLQKKPFRKIKLVKVQTKQLNLFSVTELSLLLVRIYVIVRIQSAKTLTTKTCFQSDCIYALWGKKTCNKKIWDNIYHQQIT